MTLSVTRRALLGAAAVGTVTAAARVVIDGRNAMPGFVLLHRSVGEADVAAYASLHIGAEFLKLDHDVVRQWRDDVHDKLANGGSAIAYVPWAEAGILSGLARENGGRAVVSPVSDNRFKVALIFPFG